MDVRHVAAGIEQGHHSDWTEWRVRNIDNGKEETAGLFNLKFSTTTTLPKAQARL